MKRITLLLVSSIMLSACQKKSEQIEFVKNDLKVNWNKSDEEIDDYEFDVAEMSDRDMYDYLHRKHSAEARESRGAGASVVASAQLELASKFLDSVSQSKGEKTYYNVHFYRTEGRDTIGNGYVMLNDQNKKIGFRYIK